ncbi:MAG: efflux RND transporter periplasmic adaptor subunit [Clostridium sp.]|nr:efflux RND transporter periplasmic adaptor subunit [Clostridium sp.]
MKKSLIIMLLASLSMFSLIGCGKAEVQEEKSTAVTVQLAKNEGIENSNVFSGTTKIKDETSVTVEMGGVIQEMYVTLGQHVSKGDKLLAIKGTDTENNIKTAEAALNSAKAAYSDSDVTIANTQNQLESALSNAQIAYDKAQSGYEEAQRQFSNTEQLYQAGAVAEDAYKQAKSGLEQTQKSVEQAKAGLDAAQKSYDTGVSNREQAKAAIEQSQVAYNNAVSQRDKLTLVSPVEGIITTKNFEVNETANQSQPAFIISSPNILQVDINITQADISKFSEGDTVRVTIDGQTVDGTVNYVPSVTSSKNSLYVVEILVDNSNGDFKAGMSADVEVSNAREDNTITVPKKAILTDDDGTSYVYTVGEDDRAVRADVITGIETDNKVEITSGVDADDTIVIGGLSLISDNTKLYPVVKEED